MFELAQANTSIGTAYIYDEDGSLLGEYDNGSAKAAGRTEYLWLPVESGQAIPVGILRNGNFFAIHSDHLGTPRLMTNEDNKPVWQWPYSAFGANKPTGILQATPNPRVAITNQPVLLKATAATELNLRFPGQYFDSETNLHYNYFRSYQPNQGRYTQGDPIGLEGGLNRFGYVGGNALSHADPQGLFALPALLPLIPLVPAACYMSPGCRKLFGPMFQDKTPNNGEPGSWHTNPGSGQERLYGPTGRPEVDIDWDHDHGQGQPHPHNWGPGGREVPENGFSPWPRGRGNPASCRR